MSYGCFNHFKELFKKVFKTKYIFKVIKFVGLTAYSIIFGSFGWPCFIYFERALLSNMKKQRSYSFSKKIVAQKISN
jgi:hypothetical protein